MIHCIWRIRLGKETIQEQMGGHVVSKWKENEFEGVDVTNFGFVEEISDVSWP